MPITNPSVAFDVDFSRSYAPLLTPVEFMELHKICRLRRQAQMTLFYENLGGDWETDDEYYSWDYSSIDRMSEEEWTEEEDDHKIDLESEFLPVS